MTDKEIETILKTVKAMYPTFQNNSIALAKWGKILENYDFKDVDSALDKYILEYPRDNPTPGILVNGLQTIQKKKINSSNGYYPCSRCGRKCLSPDEQTQCYTRDLRINYIEKMCMKFNLSPFTYFTSRFHQMSLKEIDDLYDNFLNKLFELQSKNPILVGNELKGLRRLYKELKINKVN